MHNLKDLRKNLQLFKKKFKERNFDFDINEFEKADKANRDLINKKELLEQEKKILSKSKEKSNFEKSKIEDSKNQTFKISKIHKNNKSKIREIDKSQVRKNKTSKHRIIPWPMWARLGCSDPRRLILLLGPLKRTADVVQLGAEDICHPLHLRMHDSAVTGLPSHVSLGSSCQLVHDPRRW